jgi:hypothetical protein
MPQRLLGEINGSHLCRWVASKLPAQVASGQDFISVSKPDHDLLEVFKGSKIYNHILGFTKELEQIE